MAYFGMRSIIDLVHFYRNLWGIIHLGWVSGGTQGSILIPLELILIHSNYFDSRLNETLRKVIGINARKVTVGVM